MIVEFVDTTYFTKQAIDNVKVFVPNYRDDVYIFQTDEGTKYLKMDSCIIERIIKEQNKIDVCIINNNLVISYSVVDYIIATPECLINDNLKIYLDTNILIKCKEWLR